MNYGIILLKTSKIDLFFFQSFHFYSNRCEEFLHEIDTQFFIDEQSPSQVIHMENQLTEYHEIINQEFNLVTILFDQFFIDSHS